MNLADAYAAIAYYLRHGEDVANYLKRRAAEAEAHQAAIESDRPRIGQEELLARRAARERTHAPTGQ